MKKARTVYDIAQSRDGWRIKAGGEVIATFGTQRAAILFARRKARADQRAGGLAQIRVHRPDGRIREEWTYGSDPRRTPG